MQAFTARNRKEAVSPNREQGHQETKLSSFFKFTVGLTKLFSPVIMELLQMLNFRVSLVSKRLTLNSLTFINDSRTKINPEMTKNSVYTNYLEYPYN